MLNFGLGELRLVDPQCDWLSDDAKARASGASVVLDEATVFSSVEEASKDLYATYATTARLRDVTMEVSGWGKTQLESTPCQPHLS
jgi:tRNA C32,U32 (ribose-2'-O)-methylase TrmJ